MKKILHLFCALVLSGSAVAQEAVPPKFQGADVPRFMARLVGEFEKAVDETQTPVADLSAEVVVRMTVDAEGEVSAWQYLDNTCEGRDRRDLEPATARTRELLATALGRLESWTPASEAGKPVSYTTTMNLRFPVAKIAKKQEADPLLFLGGDPQKTFSPWVLERLRYDGRYTARGTEGLVHVKFYIEPDGRIATLTVEKSPDDKLARELIRVIRSSKGKWTPRKVDGVPQRTAYDCLINCIND